MFNTLKIAGMEIYPGKRKKTMIKVGELPDSSNVYVPFIVVNGKEDGPILVLRGGEHGSEYCGQEQVRTAALEVDPEKLSGSIIAVPNCNPLAYQSGTYKNIKVYDNSIGENINYPGDPNGNFDQRVANLIWKEALSKADVTLSMHDGATHWIARYITNISNTINKKELGEKSLQIAKAFGVGLPIDYNEVPEYSGYRAELLKQNIPFMTIELGGMRCLWPKDYADGIKGITNVMKHLNMINGDPEPSEQIIFKEKFLIRCEHGGVLKPAFSPLDIPLIVEEEEELCTITNLLGDELEVLRSPFKGVVFCARSNCATHTGDWLYGIGKVN